MLLDTFDGTERGWLLEERKREDATKMQMWPGFCGRGGRGSERRAAAKRAVLESQGSSGRTARQLVLVLAQLALAEMCLCLLCPIGIRRRLYSAEEVTLAFCRMVRI